MIVVIDCLLFKVTLGYAARYLITFDLFDCSLKQNFIFWHFERSVVSGHLIQGFTHGNPIGCKSRHSGTSMYQSKLSHFISA